MTLTLIPSPPGVDTHGLRRAASRLSTAAERYESAAQRLATRLAGLPEQWQGTAGAAAVGDLHDLQERARSAADVHAEAAGVLLLCAARVEDAQHTWSRAQELLREDHASEPAARLAALAQTATQTALAQAAAAMSDLADRAPAGVPGGLSARDHVVGFGRGAVDAVWGSVVTVAGLSLPRMLADSDGWREQVRALRDGASYAVDHPADTAAALVGWDLLRDRRYGEWAGGVAPDLLSGAVSGGSLPLARRSADLADDLDDLADDVDDLQRVHGRGLDSNAGGPVEPGPHLPDGYVAHIEDLTPDRRQHILDGDKRGGGHRPGTGRSGKTEFPAHWTDDHIIRRVMQTARSPQSGFWNSDRTSFNVTRTFDGVEIMVAVTKDGMVKTGYPLGGPGVVRNR